MRARNHARWITSAVTGALLALLAGCAEEARPSAEPPPVSAPILSTTPVPTSGSVEGGGSAAPVVRRSSATPKTPREVDAPVSVRVPAIDIDAEVVAVGVDEDGRMELPDDPNVVGWYRFGPAAGADAGSTVLAAHVDSRRYGIGQFAQLTEAEVGDDIEVRTSAGAVHEYVVVDVQVLPKAELPTGEIFSRDSAPRLMLITCAGDFDGTHYPDNAIVTAEPK